MRPELKAELESLRLLTLAQCRKNGKSRAVFRSLYPNYDNKDPDEWGDYPTYFDETGRFEGDN